MRCQCSKSIYTTIFKRIPSNELWIPLKQKNCSFFLLFIHVVASHSFGCASAWAINASLNNIIIKIWTVWTLPNVTNRTHRNATHRFQNKQVKKTFFLCFLLKFREPNFAIFTININNESFQLTYNEQKKSALKISIWTLSFRLPLWSSSTLEVFPIELVEEMVLGMMPNHLLLSQPRMHIQPPNSKWPGIQ